MQEGITRQDDPGEGAARRDREGGDPEMGLGSTLLRAGLG